jgi:Rieske 2Fe-2S family protein
MTAPNYSNSRRLPQGAMTLPGHYYTDPAILHEETEKIFLSMWTCAGREDEIPEPGDYITRQIGNENIIIVRGEDRKARAFYNNCRHRGTRICNERSGRVKGSFQCPYHAWTFDLDGRLIGAPHMAEVKGFDKDEFPLLGVGCDVWAGHIFFNLDEKRAPLLDQIEGLSEFFERYDLGRLRRAERHEYDIKANWKLIVENYSECYHCPLIHPELNRVTHYLTGDNDTVRPNYNGGYQIIGDQFSTLTVEGKKTRPNFKGISKDDQKRVYYYVIYPNLLLSVHPDYVMTHTLWPKEPGVTYVVCEWHFDPGVMKEPNFDPSDAVGFWDLTNRQDWHACEISQLGVASRGYIPGPFTHQEELLFEFDRFVVDRLAGRVDRKPALMP